MNGRGWKILLVSSLVLNIFLLGGIAGGAYQWFSTRNASRATVAQPVALRLAAEQLSADRQKQFVEGIKLARRETKQFARAARSERDEVLRLLAAPTLDRGALEDALKRTRDADIAVRTSVEESVVDFATTLTPDERIKLVEGLKRRGNWRLSAQQQAQLQQQEQAQAQNNVRSNAQNNAASAPQAASK